MIVIHLDDGDGLTACSGNPMPDEVAPAYDKVDRYFCRACALYGKDTPECGAWGGCRLPKGHNMGKADIPENHRAALYGKDT